LSELLDRAADDRRRFRRSNYPRGENSKPVLTS
jgi:hypothetical protein